MQNETKIQLSALEMELVNNTDWILTKHHIIQKVYELFGMVSDVMKNEMLPGLHSLPENIRLKPAKISRGENYNHLPYVILDYPNLFEKNNIFAVRTMFWWGNFFSITLHVSGAAKEKYIFGGAEVLQYLQRNEFSICVNDEEWQHHFTEKNYLPASAIEPAAYLEIIEQPFFKIAKKLPLEKWDIAPGFIVENFKVILELLDISYRGGKKDP